MRAPPENANGAPGAVAEDNHAGQLERLLDSKAKTATQVGSNRLPVLAAQIVRAHHEAQQASRKSIAKAIEAGDALQEAKEHLGHGKWLSWIKANCSGLSERTIQRYMRIAERKDELQKRHDVSDLSLRGAIEALATSDFLKEAAERINDASQKFKVSRDMLVQELTETRASKLEP